MAICVILSDLFSKQPDTLSSIAFASLVLLLYNPLMIFDVGFLLSFGGTLGIVIFEKRINSFFFKHFLILNSYAFFNYIIEVISVSLSAQIIIIPIMLIFFNTFSLISIITNIVVSPLVPLISVLGIVLYLVALLNSKLSYLLSFCLIVPLKSIVCISKILSSVPYANILLPTPPYIFIVLYYLVLFMIYNKKLSKSSIKIIICLSLICIIFNLSPRNYVEVNFVDVGQGDCTHIKTRRKKNILIDCGGSENSDYDVGKKVLIPYLLNNSNGIVDAVFLSHFHEDHVEACIELLKSLCVKRIYIIPQSKETFLFDEILKLSKKNNVHIIYLKNGDIVKIDDVLFEVLYPTEDTQNLDLNNSSMIIKVKANDTSILFTGDAENEEETLLIKDFNKLKLDADILKVGHHGSKTSSSLQFLNIVTPYISVISCGVDNKFKHPNDETINKLNVINSKIYRTDLSGEISLKIYKNNKIKIQTAIL